MLFTAFKGRISLLRLSVVLVSAVTLFCGVELRAQELPFAMEMPVEGIDSYDPAIPTPQSVIGHVIGTRHTAPHEVVEYFRAVADASDRVVLQRHGETHEGRALIHAIVTSPENHAQLEEIRLANRLLADSPNTVTDGDISRMPVIAYQGYSIHGDEASGTEAGVLYLYHLAAGRGPAVDDALNEAVLIVDPLLNPDGRDRFTDWVNGNRGAVEVSDSQDREHNQTWPGGRTNHYWFDLNRDWLPAQHPESQGRMAVFHGWRPQVLTDHHEMGTNSTFFFQPGIPSRNNPNTPERTYELTGALAEFHAKRLDSIGSLYYTRESFDDFYYGKGSSYPDINGAVGILFEQASSRALLAESNIGPLHYAYTVRNQFAASLSTLEGVVALREDLLRHHRDFYANALEMAADSDVQAWVLGLRRGRTRAQLLAQLLQRHRVRIHNLSETVEVDGVRYGPGEAFVIPASQPQYRFIESVVERSLTYQDSLFYDVSTWTLPLAFDVDFHEFTGAAGELLGSPIEQVVLDGGGVRGGQGMYAYVLKWDRFFAPAALFRLLEEGYDARLVEKDFTAMVNGAPTDFERGSIVIPAVGRLTPGDEADVYSLGALVEELAETYHVNFHAVSTGLTPSGPDLGGSSTDALDLPVVAVLTGPGTSSYQAGEAWHTLSSRFGVPVSLLDADRVQRSDLSRYTTIVVTGGFFDSEATDGLREFTRSGGNLIVMPGATNWAMSNEFVALETARVDVDSLMADLAYDDREKARGAQGIGGSIFQVELDTTHPLAYGLPARLPVFHTGSALYTDTEQTGFVVGQYTSEPLLSGYLSEEARELVPESVSVLAAGHGRGNVIVFMDRLNFRAFWYGSQRLFLNAIMFGSTF